MWDLREFPTRLRRDDGTEWVPQVVAQVLAVARKSADILLISSAHPKPIVPDQASSHTRESTEPTYERPEPGVRPAASCRPGACEPGQIDSADLPPVRPAARRFAFLVGLGACLTIVPSLIQVTLPTIDTLILATILTAATAAAWYFPVRFGPRTRIELNTTAMVASILLLPMGLAALIAGSGPLLVNLRRREPWEQAGFNAAQSVLQVLAGGLVMVGLGWQFDQPNFSWPHPLPSLLPAALVMYAVNTMLVAGIVALQDAVSFGRTWKTFGLQIDRQDLLAHCSQLGLGILAAAVMNIAPWLLIPLLLPALATYGALNQHAKLRLLAEDKLIHQASHDSLTDLPNRALLLDRLATALTRTADERATLAVLMLDLDHFKTINDTLGHQAGDLVLTTVAERLVSCVRPVDTVARLGGDEFTIILDGLENPKQMHEIAERISTLLAQPIDYAGKPITLSASIGIATPAPGRPTTVEHLLHDADVALYQAKAAGRARVSVFHPSLVHVA